MLLAWSGLFAVRIGLMLMGYRLLIQALARLSPTPRRKRYAPRARAAALLIEQVRSWYPKPPASCLHRSIVLWWSLRFIGIDSVIRTGIRRGENGELDLHAWVEQGGVIINDRADTVARYTSLWPVLSSDIIARYKLR